MRKKNGSAPVSEQKIDVAPLDANGRLIKLGDWARIIQAPLSIVGARLETQAAFVSAIGHTLQVMEIARNGELEFDLSQKLENWDSIYLEPCCCVVTRSPKKCSKRFQEYLTLVSTLDVEHGRPEYRAQP
jgi:hypothetical protein